ncbi:hypothetical protein HMPREF2863_11095 [Micrococcus sp. HMSC067E09]|uniref:hypothetical protein n=1 Tax=Micrococcus sp. HMSC067E09 TaxID=1739367 RepID=UPI0008A1A696|nr:hypothetical protein [Micrococcus sp. HMSC067E09]OFR88623.1 hypothetical protein HMPREF2863_11095 [Micrococcus sp. HMSC067E09]
MKRVSSAVAAIALTAAVISPQASAASIYEHIGYRGAAQGGENVPRLYAMNDKTSSVRTYGKTVYFFEDAHYGGMGLGLWVNVSDLRSYKVPLAPLSSWNDRISSWYTK